MTADRGASSRAAELGAAFDRAFEAAPPPAPGQKDRMLLVRAGSQGVAVRLADLARLEPVGRLVALPPGVAGRLGLAAVRGRLVPVFDLAVLLGALPGAAAPGLLLLPAGREEVALACSHREALVDVPAGSIRPAAAGSSLARLAPSEVVIEDEVWPVLDLATLVEALLVKTGAPRPERT